MSPLVSIGLPVYNAELFLEEAIDSILNQTFGDFELIISDNASTDQTAVICQKYMAIDGRIRYYRSVENLGAAPNFNKVYQLSQGQYFKWMAADDTIEPMFLESCLALLEKDPKVVLAYSKADFVRPSGQYWWTAEVSPDLSQASIAKRFQAAVSNFWCLEIFGLIRRDILESTSLIGSYYGSDKVLLAQLSLLGPFKVTDGRLFHRRCHANQSSRLSKKERDLWIDSRNGKQPKLFRSRISLELFKSILGSPISLAAKTTCLEILGLKFIKKLPFSIRYHFGKSTPNKI
jgi:glycosyltransferase involved in cell wall biosynthesis